jgi:hypothetical protein
MKRTIIAAALAIAASSALADTYIDNLWWSAGGVNYAREWIDGSNRINYQALQANQSTALNLWSTASSQGSNTDSYSEITLYRTNWAEVSTRMERFNISAMTGEGENSDYRFGVERSGAGQFRGIRFCFESVSPGIAVCPFRVTPDGVFININGEWRPVAYQ